MGHTSRCSQTTNGAVHPNRVQRAFFLGGQDETDATAVQFVPQVEFSDLATLSADRIADIKRKGSIVVRGVVSQETALAWKEELKTIVADNPDIVGAFR